MPVTSLRAIERVLELGGCRVPAQLGERLQAVADDRAAARDMGVECGTLTEVADVPVTFSRHDRRHQLRTIRRDRAALPGALARWRGSKEYHRALAEYARRPS